jgi:hypothetical protein
MKTNVIYASHVGRLRNGQPEKTVNQQAPVSAEEVGAFLFRFCPFWLHSLSVSLRESRGQSPLELFGDESTDFAPAESPSADAFAESLAELYDLYSVRDMVTQDWLESHGAPSKPDAFPGFHLT